jgi:ATP-dependent Clp protease ATP-binding subunit ClpC
LLDELEVEKKKWEEETKSNRETVSEDNVAEVVAMMTGVPVQRIAQNEGSRLMGMYEAIKDKVIGQDEAIT